jgi:hypothetical protein
MSCSRKELSELIRLSVAYYAANATHYDAS